jgi:hypothetical protein
VTLREARTFCMSIFFREGISGDSLTQKRQDAIPLNPWSGRPLSLSQSNRAIFPPSFSPLFRNGNTGQTDGGSVIAITDGVGRG